MVNYDRADRLLRRGRNIHPCVLDNTSIMVRGMDKNPVCELIGKWPSRATLAGDIGVNVERVHKWAQHGAIPSGYQQAVIVAAGARGIAITPDRMLEIHANPELLTTMASADKGATAGQPAQRRNIQTSE